MQRIAVIGSGISGLAAAYYLSRKHEVHVFEVEHRLGGHTQTIVVPSCSGSIPIDIGFIVYNEQTYPKFSRLLRNLGVGCQPTCMSFAVTSPSFEYSSRGLGGFFAQRSNLFAPEHYLMFKQIRRFNREAAAFLHRPESESQSIVEFLNARRYSRAFVERYLLPMTAAIWSMSPTDMQHFPALTLMRFMHNHRMLGGRRRPRWLVIRGGSSEYLRPLTAPFHDRINLGIRIRSVARSETCVTLTSDHLPPISFDQVVFACHGDQVLPLLSDATRDERQILISFTSSKNTVCLHTDHRLLPSRPAARASWNYLLRDSSRATVTYDMNRLQSLRTSENYCVTVNDNGEVDSSRVIHRTTFEHPIYTTAAVFAQRRWAEISGKNRTHFCGAYWFYGFHEDGVRAALRVVQSFGVDAE